MYCEFWVTRIVVAAEFSTGFLILSPWVSEQTRGSFMVELLHCLRHKLINSVWSSSLGLF